MIPLVQMLAAKGLGMLASAVTAKGQQYVEEKLGVQLTSSSDLELKQLELDHEEMLLQLAMRGKELEIEAEKSAQAGVTQRWQADMLSDSWLSKNIRPMVLLFLLGVYTLFSVGSGFGFHVTQSYVELLGQMLMLAYSAYFVGRTVEKVTDMKERGK